MIKKAFFIIIGVILSTILTLGFFETLLYYFPVNEGLRVQPVNEESPIFRFEPNREVQYSKHWNFDISNKVKINNDGFVNNADYLKNSKKPLLSIIGDSYVEALMVPFDKSISGILGSEANDKRVYSFAASGAGLSQHLIWAKYAKKNYRSDAFIFVIIANDFSESLYKYESSPGFHRFNRKDNNDWEFVLSTYEPSLSRKILRKSKLAMYAITNLNVHKLFKANLNLGQYDKREQYISNFRSDVSSDFWKEAKWATQIYLENIENFAGVNKNNILFVIDGVRPHLYDDNQIEMINDSFWVNIRNYFLKETSSRGFEVLDMQDKFRENYQHTGKKFEFISDSHWNAHGHSVVADSIIKSRFWKKFSYVHKK